jgi:hypothetical protein
MKQITNLLQHSLLAAGLFLMVSCSNETNEKAGAVKDDASATAKAKGQFPFYKDINVKPGLNFEVVSWGKGGDSVGGYLILMSDSVKKQLQFFFCRT